MRPLKCFIIVLLFTCMVNLSYAEHCSICVVDTCQTTYPTYGDGDGDGMNDDLEFEIAAQFHPVLYLDNAYSERPYRMPSYYNTPFYADDSPDHNAPPDVVSNGTVYYRVRPFRVAEPGRSSYIEIAYLFYYIYNIAECTNGPLCEHGHDWEHIAVAIVGSPGDYKVVRVFYAQHLSGEWLNPDEVSWAGTPEESGVNVFIVNGSHASYPWPGQRCTYWVGPICGCYENANGQFSFHSIILTPLWELGDSRAPAWLDYSSRWPGDDNWCFGTPLLPYGPACGEHSNWWNYSHFMNLIPACERTWIVDIPEPQYFQVSNFRNGQQLTNALYLTWEDPYGGPRAGFALQRCLVPDFNDGSCKCIAQLGPDVHSYFDSCLDGGMGFFYFLKTYHYHSNPAYRGCSWPAFGYGMPYGGLCDKRPTAPAVKTCDSCILRWEDHSWNEDGFIIGMRGEICDTVGPDVEEYPVSNCCTGKYQYHVAAFNEYGENCNPQGVGCNSPGCQPRDGCGGSPNQAPFMGQSGIVILICLLIASTVFNMLRRRMDVG